MNSESSLIEKLNSFMAPQRQSALLELYRQSPAGTTEKPWVNLHLHSFFSFNGEGWSPSRLSWEARRRGLYAVGLCDFDTLDGMNEFFDSTDRLRLRAAAAFESRVFFEEYGDREINSPGEPGVFYFMGAGFVEPPPANRDSGQFFAKMLEQSHQRNRELIERINRQLDQLELNYERDVQPLTPSGNATERHIVQAYFDKALLCHPQDPEKAAAWWADELGADPDELQRKIHDKNGFLDFLRGKMMKSGGLGYRQPTPDSFPPLDRVVKMILDCRAIPTSAWLDGASPGESDPKTQLECLMAKGVAAVNIIPDRNWNYRDPETRAEKVKQLYRYTETADRLELPIMVGTEMNKAGQRFVDDFEAEPMRKVAPSFLRGAQVLVGHTRMLRFADFSYTDQAAAEQFPDRRRRNDFFAAVGRLPAPPEDILGRLEEMSADAAFAYLTDSARAENWLSACHPGIVH